MEFCLGTLGVSLPIRVLGHKRRERGPVQLSSVKAETFASAISSPRRGSRRVLMHRDSIYLYDKSKLLEDDDSVTATSVSTTDLSSGSSEEFELKHVHFATPLVTEVRTRPLTTREDKYYLHYNEHDYVDFKVAFLTGRDRCRQVTFAREVVSEVQTPVVLTDIVPREDLYYSETELQGFLDDFVQSLNRRMSA